MEKKNWKQLETLFEGLKNHKGRLTLKIDVSDEAFGPNYSYLQNLLSHNRKLTVMDDCNDIYSDGVVIDTLYSLNRFYQGSEDFMGASTSERPSLVTTALKEIASNDFRRSALLLANHTDVLYELIQCANLDAPNRSRRVRRPRRATKRTQRKSVSPYYSSSHTDYLTRRRRRRWDHYYMIDCSISLSL